MGWWGTLQTRNYKEEDCVAGAQGQLVMGCPGGPRGRNRTQYRVFCQHPRERLDWRRGSSRRGKAFHEPPHRKRHGAFMGRLYSKDKRGRTENHNGMWDQNAWWKGCHTWICVFMAVVTGVQGGIRRRA